MSTNNCGQSIKAPRPSPPPGVPPVVPERLFLAAFRGVKSRLFYERIYYAGLGAWQTVDDAPGGLINTVHIFGTDGQAIDQICKAHGGHNFGDGYDAGSIKKLFATSMDLHRFI